MIHTIRVRLSQGAQYITDLRKIVPVGFRGRPKISEEKCPSDCRACLDVCPTDAISLDPVRIDLGKCTFCNECALECPESKIVFTTETRMGARSTADLIVTEGAAAPNPVEVSRALKSMFGRSLRMRQVSSGGCNACELEMNALANVNFDLQRFGIEWVPSPRHADALVLTGPLTKNMADAVRLAWEAMPDPRFIVSVGTCAISGGLFADASGVDRSFLTDIPPVLYIPGCPPHPLTFVTAILDLLGID